MTDRPWWEDAVLYQVYPRSFQDTNGDGIGDLEGIRQRLDHFVDLGIDGVWISPIYPSPMADYGYDVSDYCGIDPSFGTRRDARTRPPPDSRFRPEPLLASAPMVPRIGQRPRFRAA